MNLPITSTAADALAAVKAHTDILADAERGQVLAIAAAADSYRIDLDAMGEYADRLIQGGADGTPHISEFLCLELGPLLGISPASAANRLNQVLNVRHRHPRLWDAFLHGTVRFWAAAHVAHQADLAGLTLEAALWIDQQVATALMLQPLGRVLNRLPEWIVRADPAFAAEKARQAADSRYVHIGEIVDGHTDLWGRLNAADGLVLDDALDVLADQLTLDAPKRERRAAALGHLARTVFGQHALPTADTASPGSLAVAEEGGTVDGAGASGASGRRWPKRRKADLIIRLSGVDDQVATIQGWGTLPTGQLGDLLQGCSVTIRPIIIPDQIPAEDGYRPSGDLRLAVTERNPVCGFPFGNLPANRTDLDHTKPYDWTSPHGAGQTRYDNLTGLSRLPHRGKTHAGWRLQQLRAGHLHWTSPGGYEYLVTPAGTILIRTPTRTPRGWPASFGGAPPGLVDPMARRHQPPDPGDDNAPPEQAGASGPPGSSAGPPSGSSAGPQPGSSTAPPATGEPPRQGRRGWPRDEPSPAERRLVRDPNDDPPPF